MVKRHQRPVPGRPNLQVGRDREGGPDPRLQRGDRGPQGPQAHARGLARSTSRASACASPGAPARSSTDGTSQRPIQRRDPRRPGGASSATRRRCRRPRLVKVTLNMGVGEAKQDSKMLEAAQAQLADIAGQKPNIRRARKSVAAFKLREGMPVGLTVTLRDVRAYEFLDRLTSVAIPRLRDFRGLNPKLLRRPRATTPWASRSRSSSRRSTTTPSTRSAASTSRSRPPPRPTPRRSRSSTPSACRSRATGARSRFETLDAGEPVAA